jgi:hypothetical protein
MNAFEAMIDETIQVNRALTERRACLVKGHWITCCRCPNDEDVDAVASGRACFIWRHSVACLRYDRA